MNCGLCKRSEDECTIAEGIFDGEIMQICTDCANKEHLPLIKRPTPEQVAESKEVNYSVRDRMEKMSNNQNPSVTPEQAITHKNLAKLKFPEKRQEHELLAENYDWKLKTARRRKKLTTGGLATVSGVNESDILSLEKGQLVQGFEQIMIKLEDALGAEFLKNRQTRISFIKEEHKDEIENEILNEVSGKIDEVKQPKKENIFRKIASGRFDFSKKEDIEEITLNDLAEMKKEKEKGELFGDDELEIEDDFEKEESFEEVQTEKKPEEKEQRGGDPRNTFY